MNEKGGHVDHIEKGESHTEFWWENLIERDNFENTSLDGKVILKLISSLWDKCMV